MAAGTNGRNDLPEPLSKELFDELEKGLLEAFRDALKHGGGDNRQAMAMISKELRKLQAYKPE